MTRSSRLFKQTLIYMILMFGIIAMAISLMAGWHVNTVLIREFESKATALARTMAESDLNLIINRDAASIQSRIDQYLKLDGVAYVVVADAQGEVLAHTFVPVMPDFVKNLVQNASDSSTDGRQEWIDTVNYKGQNQAIHVIHKVMDGLAGFIHVGMDKAVIDRDIRSAIVEMQFLVLGIFAGCVILSWIVIRRVTRPITNLTVYARRVAEYDFSGEIDTSGKGEVGELARVMKGMAGDMNSLVSGLEKSVNEATEELQKSTQALEQKVQERTSELSRANIQLKIEVAERKVVGEALKKAENKYRGIFENAVEGIFQISPDGRYVSANPAMSRIFGFEAPREFMFALSSAEDDFFLEKGRRAEFLRRLNDYGEAIDFESQIRRADGKVVWICENARKVLDSMGKTFMFEGSVEDITLRKQAEEQLLHQAFHDPLTNLPNRALFQDHLRMALERSKRRPGYLFSVLYLDLDRFKIINDSLGHDVGDELLKSVARLLEKCARTMDTVARFGGDEFAVLLEEITAPRDAIHIAKRILEQVSNPFEIEGYEVFTSASIGIVLNTDNYTRPEMLLRDADTAMYRAKEMGKARFKVFNQKMHEQALRLMELETDLRKAVDQNEFKVVFQPIVNLDSGLVAGFEALVRWHHPEQGVISPATFIPLAEDMGLIYSIDNIVLTEVCNQVVQWKKEFPERYFDSPKPMTVNLNVSGKYFKQPQLVGQVERALESTGLDSRILNLEITENALMEDPDLAEDILRKIKGLGCGVSVDDFGTGYSSLSYLQRFPIDVLKIDRSFVMGMAASQDSRAIVKTILSLGDSLAMKVVAEGVEKQGQMEMLRNAGCRFIQGYFFSKPMEAEVATELLASGALYEKGVPGN